MPTKKSKKSTAITKKSQALKKKTDAVSLTLTPSPLSRNQLLKILQETPPKHIHQRPAKGGGTWDYVTGTYTKKSLNYIFGWMWSFDVLKEEEKYGQIVITGKLTIQDKKGKPLIWRTQAGGHDITFKKGTKDPLDYANDKKAAITDCLKKCASELGLASDVYGGNEFKKVVDDTLAAEKMKDVTPKWGPKEEHLLKQIGQACDILGISAADCLKKFGGKAFTDWNLDKLKKVKGDLDKEIDNRA